MKILIVDDDPTCLRILKELLAAEARHHVTAATSGDEAWLLLDNPSRYFDVVIMDVKMPEPDGLQLLQRIRQSDILRSLRFVFCTGATDKATITAAIQLGARHFIVKPATAPLIQAKLKQIEAEIAADAAPRERPGGIVYA